MIADGFGPAEHLGPEVNSAGDEWAPAILAEPSILYFTGDRPGRALGKYGIYRIRFRVRS